MSSDSENEEEDDDPPSIAVNRDAIGFSVDVEPPANSFIDNYHIGTSEDNESLSEKMVHYVGGHILPDHWVACKAVLVFYAGSTTTKSTVMTKRGKEEACLEVYKEAVANLDTSHFGVECRHFFLHSFKKKEEPMAAAALWRYYQESRTKMRCSIIPLLPANISKMKSGKGFHDTFDEVFRSQFRRDLLRKNCMTVEEVDRELPPSFWEYKKSPWFFGLTVKIFRRHPQLAPDVHAVLSDVANAPQSRAEMLREKQQRRIDSKKVKVEPATPIVTGSHTIKQQRHNQDTTRKVVWAKVHTAKAMEQNSNVASRLGRVEELEKTLNLLDRIRPVIGEADYRERIDCLAASLPNLGTYNAEVEVIVIDDDEEDDNNDNHDSHDENDFNDENSPPTTASKQLFTTSSTSKTNDNSSKKRKSSVPISSE